MDDQVNPPKKETNKAPQRSTFKPLKPKHKLFVKAYIANGGNATQAYVAATGNNAPSAGINAHHWLKKPYIRERIEAAMMRNGVDEDAVSQRVYSLLAAKDGWSIDRGITHSRAILGLDAPSESHVQVDKRSVNLTVSSEDAKSLLKDLLSKSK